MQLEELRSETTTSPTSQANNYSVGESSGGPFTPNLRGPYGELPQSIYTQDLDGNPVEIQDHEWGHVFEDAGRRWDLT